MKQEQSAARNHPPHERNACMFGYVRPEFTSDTGEWPDGIGYRDFVGSSMEPLMFEGRHLLITDERIRVAERGTLVLARPNEWGDRARDVIGYFDRDELGRAWLRKTNSVDLLLGAEHEYTLSAAVVLVIDCSDVGAASVHVFDDPAATPYRVALYRREIRKPLAEATRMSDPHELHPTTIFEEPVVAVSTADVERFTQICGVAPSTARRLDGFPLRKNGKQKYAVVDEVRRWWLKRPAV